jgi:hypothetical protein
MSESLEFPNAKGPPSHMPVHKQQGNLFNPDTDPIPMRCTAERETSSESGGSSYPLNPPQTRRDIIATSLSVSNSSTRERMIRYRSPQLRRGSQRQIRPATAPRPFPPTPHLSCRQVSHFLLAPLMGRPRRFPSLITSTNLATSPRRTRFRTSSRSN